MFIRHTFKAEMSYLNTKRKSICHHWCHHWSALKSGVDLPRLKRPSLCVPDPPPTHTQLVTSLTARQTFFFLTFFFNAGLTTSFMHKLLLLCAEETFSFVVVSFWRRLGVESKRWSSVKRSYRSFPAMTGLSHCVTIHEWIHRVISLSGHTTPLPTSPKPCAKSCQKFRNIPKLWPPGAKNSNSYSF